MERKIFENRLEMLLLNKPFNALSAGEKNYALGLLTEEEYNEYSIILLNYKKALLADYNEIEPSPKVLENLTEAFRLQHQPGTSVFKFINYRVLSAATGLLLIGCVLVILLHTDKKQDRVTFKINKPQPVNIQKALKKEPVSAVALTQKDAYISHKKKTHIATKSVSDDFGRYIPVIDSLADTPCFDPRNTSMQLPQPYSDQSKYSSGS